MITHPSAAEIARAIAQWIDAVRPQLDARNAYLARVAANGLAIIEREIAQSQANEEALVPRLTTVLGQDGTYDSQMDELCNQLRTGRVNMDTPDLLAILRADTVAKLEIDQPKYRYTSE